jgi:hypothetical protein
MRNFFKLGLSVSAMMLLASAMPACGSDDEEDPKGTGATGGSGGSTGGSGGATGGSGGSTGGSAGSTGGSAGTASGCAPAPTNQDPVCAADPCTCGSDTCAAYKLGGLIDVPPCCSGGDTCGLSVSEQTGSIVSIGAGCYELAQEGNADTTCPVFAFTNPITQMPAEFDGCCRPNGECGYAVDLSSADGPNLGCVPAACSGGATVTTCTPGGSDAGTGGSAGSSGDAATD